MSMNPSSSRFGPCLAVVTVVAGMIGQLFLQGRIGWCACGGAAWWAGDIWSAHNSQHLFDPYSFTHVLHGMVFCGLIAWLLPRLAPAWQLWLAISVEALWEVLENSAFIIRRYREATIGIGYEGDSVANSVADVLCCALGFILARRLGFRRSLLVFVVTEMALAFWVRDNLTLNVLMLIWPIDAIKTWQMN
jgi:hypothetical protein